MDGNCSFWREVRNGKHNMKRALREGEGLPLSRIGFSRHVGGLDFTGGVNFI